MKLSHSSHSKEDGFLSWSNQAVMLATKRIVASLFKIICLKIAIWSRMRAQEE